MAAASRIEAHRDASALLEAILSRGTVIASGHANTRDPVMIVLEVEPELADELLAFGIDPDLEPEEDCCEAQDDDPTFANHASHPWEDEDREEEHDGREPCGDWMLPRPRYGVDQSEPLGWNGPCRAAAAIK